MGSFNVGCGISGLTVHEGDEIGFIMISDKPVYRSHRPERPETRTMHTYTTDLYDPYLPPVYGVYNDYGQIAELKISPTTQVIEDVFNRPALDVINAVGQDRGPYSTFNGIAQLYLPAKTIKILGNFNASDKSQFEVLGFESAAAPEGYTHAYRYDKWELRARAADTKSLPPEMKGFQWTLIQVETEEVLFERVPAYYGLEEIFSSFATVTGLLPGFDKEDWRAVKKIQHLSGMFFLKQVYEVIVDSLFTSSWERDGLKRNNDRFESAMNELADPDCLYPHSLSDLTRDSGLRGPEMWRKLLPMVRTGEFTEIYRLTSVLTTVNRMLMPSLNGEQHGNDAASGLLARLEWEILEDRRKKWDEF